MSKNDDDFKRDRFIFEILINRYEELERKTNIIDSKISNMIAVIGTLLTIQGPLYTFLLSWFKDQKECFLLNILFLILIIIILGFYAYSMKLFVEAYYFKEYIGFPNSNRLIEYINLNCNEHKILGKSIGNVAESVDKNHETNQKKVKKAKEGFEFFINAGIFSIAFIFVFSLAFIVLN